ncbi:T9SS type B sorting domain-containing protein [Inquilinus sp. KBS0705]|nr:T9SS type B sorting domain-containing protein [Inquilinus sp. KBS0705]
MEKLYPFGFIGHAAFLLFAGRKKQFARTTVLSVIAVFCLAPASFAVKGKNTAPAFAPTQSQTITFAAPAAKTYGNADFLLGATASSKLAVSYTSSNTAIATIVSGKVHIIKAGTVTITATQAGNTTFKPAPAVARTLTINKAALSIIADNKTKIYGAPMPVLTATYFGFVNGDDKNDLTTLPKLSTTITATSHVITSAPISISGAVAANYNITYKQGVIAVTPANLTITADGKTKVYGAALPALTVTYNGFVNGDKDIATKPKLFTNVTAASHVVGSYFIAPSGAADPDYLITYVNGKFTITPAFLTVTADNKTKVYGTANPVLTAIYTGFVNGDNQDVLTKRPTLSTTATTSSHVNTGYLITATGASDEDYSFIYKAGLLSITPAKLVIDADDKSKTVGAANPALTVTYTGFVNGDNSLTTQPNIKTTATTTSAVGTYPITASDAFDTDYTITYTAGVLTVKALPFAFPDIPPVTYGVADFLPGATSGSPITYSSSNPDVASITEAKKIHVSHAGTVNITAKSGDKTLIQTLVINKALITVTGGNATNVYGANLTPFPTITYTGFVNGETRENIGAAKITVPINATSPVGTYPYTPFDASSSNYTFKYVAGAYTVTKAPLNISVGSLTIVKGSTIPTIAFNYDGFRNDDNADDLSQKPKATYSFTSSSPAGIYDITVSGALATNYSITYTKGTMTITNPILVPVITYGAQGVFTLGTPGTIAAPTVTVATIPAVAKTVTTIAGTGSAGSANGTGTAASFNFQYQNMMAVDKNGNMYIADQGNYRIRKMTSAGVVTNFVGNGTDGDINATGTAASIGFIYGMVTDNDGNLYVSDYEHYKIKKITPAGVVTTLAGSGVQGTTDGTGSAASFFYTTDLTIDASGNLFTLDHNYNTGVGIIRRITKAGVVTTYFTDALLSNTENLVVDKAGNFYTSGYDYVIQKIQPDGIIKNFVGDGTNGTTDGTGVAAKITISQGGMDIDKYGDIYFTDLGAHAIRRITPAGVVTTVVGTGAIGSTDGTLNIATLDTPVDVVFDVLGNMYIADGLKQTIRAVNAGGFIILPKLPAGLVFNSATGAVSGTPQATTGGALFKVTGFGADAYGTATLSLKINNIAAPGISYPESSYTVKEGESASGIVPTITGQAFNGDNSFQNVASIFAGTGAKGKNDGAGNLAIFNYANGKAAADRSGNVFVADQLNNCIRKVDRNGFVSTFAGSATGEAGFADGSGNSALFNAPTGIAVDLSGNVYVADTKNNRIRKITSNGVVTTLAGNGTAVNSSDGPVSAATFASPRIITIDNSSSLYIVDPVVGSIRQFSTSGAGSVSTRVTSNDIKVVTAIAVDPLGNIFTAGSDNVIRKITVVNAVGTFAGSKNQAGYVDGLSGGARFNKPVGITVDANYNVFVADSANNRIRMITSGGQASTYAGNGTAETGSGVATSAAFNGPMAVTNYNGNVYVLDKSTTVRKIAQSGLSIQPSLSAGLSFNYYTGVISGTPTSVTNNYYTVTAYNAGGTSVTNVSITTTNSSADTARIYTIAGTGTKGTSGDGGAAIAADISSPYAMAKDESGNIYFTTDNNQIRKIDYITKKISTVAGTGESGFDGDGGPATGAKFNLGLTALAFDINGNLYVSDNNNNRIRRIDSETQVVTTVVGTGVGGLSADGTSADVATISGPTGLAFDLAGALYFSDSNNALIRKVDAETKLITTIAGGGNSTADGTNALQYKLSYVERFVIDHNNNIIIADEDGAKVLKLNAETNTISRIAGTGKYDYSGDGGLATSAALRGPMGIAIDAENNIYITDQPVSVIRKIDHETGMISTVSGLGYGEYSGDGGYATEAGINFITDILVDNFGHILVDDYSNNRIRRIGGDKDKAVTNITFAEIPAKTYGDADFSPEVNNDSGLPMVLRSSNENVATVADGIIHVVGAGTTTITVTATGDDNATGAVASQLLTVNKATITAKTFNAKRMPDQQNPVFFISYSGFVNDESEFVFITAPVATTDALLHSPAGQYTITASGGEADNYDFIYEPSILTIESADMNDESSIKPLSLSKPIDNVLDQSIDPKVSGALSPNGDGINDVLTIANIQNYPQNKLMLVNRNGDKVFELDGYDNNSKVFDGHSNLTRKLLASGTYFYTLAYKQKGIVKHKTGYVLIK